MFLKSVVAAIIIMALTGGFIYWGTSPLAETSQRADISRPEAAVSDIAAPEVSADERVEVREAAPEKTKNGWVNLNLRNDAQINDNEAAPSNKKRVKKSVNETVEAGEAAETPAVKSQLPAELQAQNILTQGLSEAKKITQPDLKDQAYLRLVDYAVAKKLFGKANGVVSSLSSPELRDTARSRIANGLARNGQSKQAFKLLDSVEVEPLKDVLRLQVIEAATELGAPR